MTDRPSLRSTIRPIAPPPEPPAAAPGPIDELTIASLVRELADGWTMPPQRLGAPAWQDRVDERRPGGGPASRSRGFRRRFVGAVSTAVVATLVLGLVAVWLAIPRTDSPSTGSSPAPTSGVAGSPAPVSTASPRPGATSVPTPTPFPQLTVFGEPLPEARLLVTSGPSYRVLDMGTGVLGDPVVQLGEAGNELILLPDGRGLCLCATYSIREGADILTLELRWLGTDGAVATVMPVGEYAGARGPAWAGSPGVFARGTLTADGRRFVVGWIARQMSAWRSGLDVVEVATGRLTRGPLLPDLPLVSDGSIPGRPGTAADSSGAPVYAGAPQVVVSPDGRRFVATQSVMIAQQMAVGRRFAGRLAGGRIEGVVPAVTGPGTFGADDCFDVLGESFAGNDVYAGLCSSRSTTILRRVAPDGGPIGDTELPGLAVGGFGFFGNASVVDLATGVAYYWSAFNWTVVKVDLASGLILAREVLPGPTAAANDPLTALAALGRSFGSWLAPSALAKVYLDPAIALSPDGSRLYLLTTNATDPTEASAVSVGVLVVDATTLAVLDRWAPTADFVSIAVSRNGRFVYAAGLSDVRADGKPAPYESSVTVFDTADGTVRAVAGRLGREWLTIRGVLTP